MKKRPVSKTAIWAGLALLIVALSLSGRAEEVIRLRAPAVAGSYYPLEPDALQGALTRYFEKATPPPPSGTLRGCIAPHAAYGFAGETIAHAFKELTQGQFTRVVILAPSNFATFQGCSVPGVEGYITPLGVVEVDQEALRTLTYSPLINLSVLRPRERGHKRGLHEEEYSIEVLLPFLQQKLGAFKLVPILVGQFTEGGGGLNRTALDTVVTQIRRVVDDKTLIVASSNLTQYGKSFGYVPFEDDIFAKIENLDKVAIEYLVKKDVAGFAQYLELSRNPIVGNVAMQMMLELIPPSCEGKLLDYDFSGRMTQTTERSVSYAAINYYQPVGTASP